MAVTPGWHRVGWAAAARWQGKLTFLPACIQREKVEREGEGGRTGRSIRTMEKSGSLGQQGLRKWRGCGIPEGDGATCMLLRAGTTSSRLWALGGELLRSFVVGMYYVTGRTESGRGMQVCRRPTVVGRITNEWPGLSCDHATNKIQYEYRDLGTAGCICRNERAQVRPDIDKAREGEAAKCAEGGALFVRTGRLVRGPKNFWGKTGLRMPSPLCPSASWYRSRAPPSGLS